jgi:hypothetical protein
MPEFDGSSLVWFLSIALIIIGLIGTLAPLLPGAPLILAGMILHKVFFPDMLTWWSIGIAIFLVVFSTIAEFWAGMLGAKYGGATKWGVIGATIGLIIGIPFTLIGMILGPIIGATIAEILFAKRKMSEGIQAGTGAAIGVVGSTILKFVIGLAMAIIFVVDCWFI